MDRYGYAMATEVKIIGVSLVLVLRNTPRSLYYMAPVLGIAHESRFFGPSVQ
jgi:hypothetical protein